jgi:hypothetical protein
MVLLQQQWMTFGVALDMLHQVMPCLLLHHICMTIKMTRDGDTFVRHCRFSHHSYL